MKFSTEIQIHCVDNAIQNLKRVFESVNSFNFPETFYDMLLAENELTHDKLQIHSLVETLQNIDAQWQTYLLRTECDENDVNAYYDKYYDEENGLLATMNEANSQLRKIWIEMTLIEIKKSPGTTWDLTTTAPDHVSIIPPNPKIPVPPKKQNIDDNAVTKIIESVEILHVVDNPITTVFSTPIDDLPLVNIIIDNSLANDTYTATAKSAIKCPTTTTTAATTPCHLQMPDYNLAEKFIASTYDPMVIINFIARFEAGIALVEHQNVHFSSVWEGYPHRECSSISDFLQLSEIAQQFLLKMLRLMFTCHATTFGCSFTFVPCSTPITFHCSQNPTPNYPNHKIN